MKLLLVLFAFSAQAIAEGPAAPAAGGPAFPPFLPILLIFAVFYFLVIRPQQKKVKEQQKFVQEMKKGDMVITNSGIIGVIKQLSEKIVTLEIDEGVNVKVLRTQIAENANTLKSDSKTATVSGKTESKPA